MQKARNAMLAIAGAMALSSTAVIAQTRDEPIQPIEPVRIENPARVELGKKLFFDPRLSRSGFISCNSCHNLSTGGADNLPSSIGHAWQQGPINSPTVLNSGMNVAQFWDGRAADLQEQAAGPIANPGEMASSHDLALEIVRSIPGYLEEFEAVYGNRSVTLDQVTEAIAAFEETLVTPNSRFDQWLQGDDTALTATELSGYQRFKEIGCASCHNGPAAGGNSFQKMGMVQAYKTSNPAEGRVAVTGDAADRFRFKVPTLRNVELTYPYFHDGSVWSLDESVDIMARVQLGRTLSGQEISEISAFLRTLTGDQPRLELPILPPSTAETPRPQPWD